MPLKLFDKRAEIDHLGRILAANGPLSREKIIAMVSVKIPPERAFNKSKMRNKEKEPHDAVVASGRRHIMLAGLSNWLVDGGLLVEHDGLLYPTPRFRRDYPELFIEEMKQRPDIYELAQRLSALLQPERVAGQKYVHHNIGLRIALREMLKMCDRDVAGGMPYQAHPQNGEAT